MADPNTQDTQVTDTTVVDTSKTTDTTKVADPSKKPDTSGTTGDWEARHRGAVADLQRERTARQRSEAEYKQLKTNFENEQKRVRALAGLDPGAEKEAEADQIRQRLFQLVPALERFGDEKTLERLEKLLGQADSLESGQRAMWANRGTQARKALFDTLKTHYGSDLSERQQGKIVTVLVDVLDNNPELKQAYEMGDDTPVLNFVKEWVEDFVEPIRRSAVASQVDRQQRVPNGGARSVGTMSTRKKIDFKDPKAVEDAMVESYRSHGGTYGD